MLPGRFLKRQKPRIYLGSLAVAPRADLKRYLDQLGVFQREDLDTALRKELKEIFSLLPVEVAPEPKGSDLVLDVMVEKFQSGDAWSFDFGGFGIPLLWRPKITVSARLYWLKSEKNKATFSRTEKLALSRYFGRLLTWRGLLRFRPLFGAEDIKLLLHQACYGLLRKVKKSEKI